MIARIPPSPRLTLVTLLGLFCSLCLSACASPDPSARTLMVLPAADGQWDDPAGMAMLNGFTTIQAAVDAANPGDTVEIPSGTYNEFVQTTSGVSLHGAGQGQTTVVGRIKVSGQLDATISALSIVCVSSVGMPMEGTSNVLVQDVEITGCSAGLLLEDVTTDVVLDDLYLHGNTAFGVELQVVERITISNCLVLSNGYGGIYATYSDDVLTTHNTIIGNGFGASPTHYQGGVILDDFVVGEVFNNIITGNTHGLECLGCTGSWSHNLVWGNSVDYTGNASSGAGDLSADPDFVAAAEGDYHLSATSPAIDAGNPAFSVATDADGEARPAGAGPDIGLDEFVESGLSLQLTEVMANPSVEGTGEFVEVLNTGSTAVDLLGMVLTDGDQSDALYAFDFSPTILEPGARAVIIDSQYAFQYAIDAAVPLLTTGDTTLGNGLTTSDPITLFESDGLTLVATFSFPSDPGDGTSLELSEVDAGDVPGNWLPSQCAGGSSPGDVACFPDAGDPAALVITEVLANALEEGNGEFVELWNSGAEPVDGAGLVLMDGGGSDDVLQSFDGGVALIPPGQHALIVDPDWTHAAFVPPNVVLLTTGDSTLGNGLSTSDTVTLFAPDGSTVIDSFSSPTDPGDGVSIEKIANGDGDVPTNWQPSSVACSTGPSPGRLNGASGGSCGPLVINEVMSNPIVEATGEFVELWNAGLDDVQLLGLVLSDGDVSEPLVAFEAGPTVLPGGGYAVIIDSGSPSAADLPEDTIVLTSGDATLGNALSTKDVISLFEADGATPIDSFGFPFNPGNGVSAERIDVAGAPDSSGNWTASPCAAGSSAGFANCAASGQVGDADSDYDVLITEVMSNPLVESTGEYVELYNAGTDPVDLAGAVLWDGDATDPLQGYADPTDTILAAGGWAVVLDSGYAGQYSIPGDALLLTTDDAAIASGLALDDTVTLFEADGVTVMGAFSWPLDAGDGVSVQRLDLLEDDVESNWAAGTCGPTPGAPNCP